VIAIGFSAARIMNNPMAIFTDWDSVACAAVSRSVVVIPDGLDGQERYRSLIRAPREERGGCTRGKTWHHGVQISFEHAHKVSDLEIER
jgi:hypothetical protein